MNILQATSKNWHRKHGSKQSKVRQDPKIQEPAVISLNKNKRKISRFQSLSSNQEVNVPGDRNIVKKLTLFIQKIEETTKKILNQKDISWYLKYAQTSEAEIMDNISGSLSKFRQLLHFIKDQRDSQAQLSNTQSKLSGFNSNIHDPPHHIGNEFASQSKKVHYEILDFVLKYFEDYMIAETHWSKAIRETEEAIEEQNKYSFANSCKSFKAQELAKEQESEVTFSSKIGALYDSFDFIKGILPLKEQRQERNHRFSDPIQETIDSIFRIDELRPIEQMGSAEKVAYLLQLESKLYVSSQFLESAAYFVDDISTSDKSSYPKVWEFIHQNHLGDAEAITSAFRHMKTMMTITNASVVRQSETSFIDHFLYKKMVLGLSFPRYFMDYGKAKLQNHKYLRNPNITLTKNVWNLPETWIIKEFQKPLFEAIKVNMEFYIPRSTSKSLKNFKFKEYPEFFNIFEPDTKAIKIRLLNSEQIKLASSSSLKRHTISGKIKTKKFLNRVSYTKAIQKDMKVGEESAVSDNFSEQQRNAETDKVFETIIIHFHGGGFIALSSETMQSYTRRWANGVNVPIFSVDYGKPPEHRFPTPALDCLEAYQFITTQIHKYMNILPKKVIIAGDSAGGNLACSLTALTLKLKIMKPSGLFLAYPAVDTRIKFTPSRINSFNDAVLYPTLLLLCMSEYLGDVEENQNNPLASPVLITEGYVNGERTSTDGYRQQEEGYQFEQIDKLRNEKQKNSEKWPLDWPKTIISVGKKDPLFDDSLRMCQRMSDANIEYHCEIYKNLSHAFLSLDRVISDCDEAIQDSIKFLKKLISGEKIGKKYLL